MSRDSGHFQSLSVYSMIASVIPLHRCRSAHDAATLRCSPTQGQLLRATQFAGTNFSDLSDL